MQRVLRLRVARWTQYSILLSSQIDPFSSCCKGYNTNPFKADKREFPIEFNSPWKEKSTVNIQLPEGYIIESSPESKAMALPEQMGMFKYQVISQGSKVRIVSVLEFNIDKIPATYYRARY